MNFLHAQLSPSASAWAPYAPKTPGTKCRAVLRNKISTIRGAASVALEGDLSEPFREEVDELTSSMAWAMEDLESAPVNSKIPYEIQLLLDEFKILLQEYRALEARVRPWSETFIREHGGRQPTWQDAELDGGPNFGAEFKELSVLKKRLYYEIPALRQSLIQSLENSAKGRHRGPKQQGHSAKNINISYSLPSAGALSKNLVLARNYRKKSSLQPPSTSSVQMNPVGGLSLADVAAGEASASARLSATNSSQIESGQPSSSPTEVPSGISEAASAALQTMLAAAAQADEKDMRSADLLASGPGNTRIKSAALAALEYRKKAKQASKPSATGEKQKSIPLPKPGLGKKLPEVSIETAQFVVRSGRKTLQEDVLPLCPP